MLDQYRNEELEKGKVYSGYYHNIPVWVKGGEDGGVDMMGKNWFWDKLVDFNIWLDINVFEVEQFPIYINFDNDVENN